jgi:CheY-like chemotaxis protein
MVERKPRALEPASFFAKGHLVAARRRCQLRAGGRFEVLAADRSVQALDLAEEVKPDLVLLDAVLPDG